MIKSLLKRSIIIKNLFKELNNMRNNENKLQNFSFIYRTY